MCLGWSPEPGCVLRQWDHPLPVEQPLLFFHPLLQATQVKLSKHEHQSSLEEEHPSNHAAWELGEALDLG